MLIDFKFNLKTRVDTPLNGVGIIDMQANDGEGVKYFVNTKDRGVWLLEEDIDFEDEFVS